MGAITDLITTTACHPAYKLRPRSPSPAAKHRADSLYVHSTEPGSGKALVSLGLIDLIKRTQSTAKIGFFRPLITDQDGKDEDIDMVLQHFDLATTQTFEESFGMTTTEARKLLGEHRRDEILEVIISKFRALEERCDFVLCEGRHGSAVEFNLNLELSKNLGTQIVILGTGTGTGDGRTVSQVMETIQISVDAFDVFNADIVGVIINKTASKDVPQLAKELEKRYKTRGYINTVIPYDEALSQPRVYDVVQALGGEVLCGKSCLDNKISGSILGTMQLQHVLTWLNKDDTLLVTSGDRGDIIVGALQAHQSTNYPSLSGIVLTGGERLDPYIERLLDDDQLDSLPIIYVNTDSFTTASKVGTVKPSLRPTDTEKITQSIAAFSNNYSSTNKDRLLQRLLGAVDSMLDDSSDGSSGSGRHYHIRRTLTPKMFEFDLVSQAKEDQKHLVLPEGTDPRIVKASFILAQRDIAQLTLLGKKEEILKIATELGVNLLTANNKNNNNRITILDPHSNASNDQVIKYAKAYYELRKHKGTVPNVAAAKDEVMDYTTFATMMVHMGDADGLVSGACHTTRHTIRPALQIIKTKPSVKLVSSVFLMCLDHKVLVYGDCAVNPNPSAEHLADIACQAAETAHQFGIDAKVAMLSYSSGTSGKGCEVEKVRTATELVRKRQPHLPVEGPIQYDAAVDPDVAASKMPNSQVAGQATVFVFPDLNTGNTCYKSIQRETAGSVCIGPILQGLKKPVNDLSRGCTVEDIVSTCVVTCVQAQQQEA